MPPAAGRPRAATPAQLRAAGPEGRRQRDRPFVTDAGKFTDTFGPLPTTPHPQAVDATLSWFRTTLNR
ncbi:hypothetical protein ACFW3D_20930 [Streptomyces sp. NPDC058864]